jgi:hypothetical protein
MYAFASIVRVLFAAEQYEPRLVLTSCAR